MSLYSSFNMDLGPMTSFSNSERRVSYVNNTDCVQKQM